MSLLVEKCGRLDVFAGPMFSKKSSMLLQRLVNEAKIMNFRVLMINHSLDDRSDKGFSTHNPLYKDDLSKITNLDFVSISDLEDIFSIIDDYDVIGIDEAQFFVNLVEPVHLMVEKHGKTVIVAGLSGTWQRTKFGQVIDLIPIATTFQLLESWCSRCAKEKKKHAPAQFTQKIDQSKSKVNDIGSKDKYFPVCRKCHLETSTSIDLS